MFNKLPLEMLISLTIWAAMIFTIAASVQLIIFERSLKKADFHKSSYRLMSGQNKKILHRLLIKIAAGLGVLIFFVFTLK